MTQTFRAPRWPYFVIAFLLLTPVLIIGGLIYFLAPSEPKISDGSVLELDLSGELPEAASPVSFPQSLLSRSSELTLRDQIDNLAKAAADKRIKGVLVRLDDYEGGWAKTEELRDALSKFKSSGKFTVGFAEAVSERDYYLALKLDEVYLVPTGRFEMNGFVTETQHWPGLLEKLGIGVQYFAYGKYKSQSGQSFGLKAYTAPVKEMINHNLDVTYNSFINAVADKQKITPLEVTNLINTSRPSAEWALANKLITGIKYRDEVDSLLKQKLQIKEDDELPVVSSNDYQKVSLDSLGLNKGSDRIGVLYANGIIVSGQGGDTSPLNGGPSQGSQPLIDALRKAGDDDSIKAVIFRVDSPGGAGLGCDLVRREVAKLKVKKPVIVSMSDYAASGGYWIAMDATAIVAQPLTATGSIGIWSVIPNTAKLNQNLALNPETFKRGKFADTLTGSQPLDPESAKIYDEELFKSYTRFVSLAAAGRGKTPAQMEVIAQGRTWLGSEALKLGLIDALGGFDVAVKLAQEKAKISADKSVHLVDLQPETSPLEGLTNLLTGATEQAHINESMRGLAHDIGLPTGFTLTPALFKQYRLFPLADPVDIH